MNYEITYECGPLSGTFTGSDRVELQTELVEFAAFVEDNESTLLPPEAVGEAPPDGESPADEPDSTSDAPADTSQRATTTTADPLVRLATACDVQVADLRSLVVLPDDIKQGVPMLRLSSLPSGTEQLGQYRNGRQAIASLVLLAIWRECYRAKRVEHDRLKRALEYSDIGTEHLDNMYNAFSGDADTYFNRGDGQVSLTTRGEGEARSQVRTLIEVMTDDA